MLKGLILFAALFAVGLPVHGQEKSSKPQANQQRAEPLDNPPAPCFKIGTINQQAAEWKGENPNGHSDSYLHHLFLPETLAAIGLLIAGIWGIKVAIRTLKSIERQTRATEATIELTKSKERASVKFEPVSLRFVTKEGIENWTVMSIDYRLPNYGITRAENAVVFYRFWASRSFEEPEPANVEASPLNVPPVLMPERASNIFTLARIIRGDPKEWLRGKSLNIAITVTYSDVFEDEHTFSSRHFWDGSINDGYWRMVSREETKQPQKSRNRNAKQRTNRN